MSWSMRSSLLMRWLNMYMLDYNAYDNGDKVLQHKS